VLCTAFDWMIQDAQFKTVQEVVSQAALFEVNRKEVNKESQVPLESWMDNTTVRLYTNVWRQLLCYIFRAEQAEPEKRPGYKLTIRQRIATDDLQAIIQEFMEWKDEHQFEPEADETDAEIEFMGRIQRKVLRLCIELLNHPLQDNEYKSVIISGLAILGIREDNGWYGAEDYTTNYSAVIKLARIMVVQEGYHRRQDAIEDYKATGLNEDQAQEKAASYFHMIRRLTNQFLVMAHDGRNPTPMQWIFKSRSYGFKIRYTTTADGCIQWLKLLATGLPMKLE
jgi:hypothetical protein